MKKNFAVFSAAIATELLNRGFKCIDSKINTRFPQFKVFYFKDTKELRTAFEEICQARKTPSK